MNGLRPVRAARVCRTGICIAIVIFVSVAAAHAEPLLPDEDKAIAAAVAPLKDPEYRLDDSIATLADTFIARGRTAAAEALYKRVVDGVDFGPGEYFEYYSPPLWISPGRMSNRIIQVLDVAYPELIKLLIARGEHDRALEYVNRCRSRLLEAVLQSKLNNNKPAAHFADMDLARMRKLAKETKSTFVIYAPLSYPTRYFSLSRRATPKTTRLFAWVVQPSGTIDFASLPIDRLFNGGQESENDPVYQAVNTFSRSVVRGVIDRLGEPEPLQAAPPTVDDRKARLRELHRALVAPLEPYLPNNPEDKVVIIPDGSLYLVPFNALIDAEGSYLVERHTLSIAPSLGIYALLVEKAKRAPMVSWKKQKSVLVVGNPTMPTFPAEFTLLKDVRLPQLAGADQEARSVAALFHVRPLIGDQALEDVVRSRMEHARVIHFATHGLLVQSSVVTVSQVSGSMSMDLPPGAIALSPNLNKKSARLTPFEQQNGIDLPYNGFLASGKILTLNLDADLVTLSACDTARGRTYEQQFVGLPSAFLAAGARTVVMTLWSIPDAPTAELMTEFYGGLLAGRSKPAALRQAILTSKGRHPDPEDWGAFTLVGLAN